MNITLTIYCLNFLVIGLWYNAVIINYCPVIMWLLLYSLGGPIFFLLTTLRVLGRANKNLLLSRFNFCNCPSRVIADLMFTQYIINRIFCFRISKASTNSLESLLCDILSMVFTIKYN